MTFLTIIIIIMAIRALGNVERSSRIRNTQKIRVCRHCHEFIPYGASICPYCHNEPGHRENLLGHGPVHRCCHHDWLSCLEPARPGE